MRLILSLRLTEECVGLVLVLVDDLQLVHFANLPEGLLDRCHTVSDLAATSLGLQLVEIVRHHLLSVLLAHHRATAGLDTSHHGIDLLLVLDQVCLSEMLVQGQIEISLERQLRKWRYDLLRLQTGELLVANH